MLTVESLRQKKFRRFSTLINYTISDHHPHTTDTAGDFPAVRAPRGRVGGGGGGGDRQRPVPSAGRVPQAGGGGRSHDRSGVHQGQADSVTSLGQPPSLTRLWSVEPSSVILMDGRYQCTMMRTLVVEVEF